MAKLKIIADAERQAAAALKAISPFLPLILKLQEDFLWVQRHIATLEPLGLELGQTPTPFDDWWPEEVDKAAGAVQRIREGKASPEEIENFLKGGATPITRLPPGTKPEPGYDRAFNRCRILNSHTTKQAFELMITEDEIEILGATDWNNRREAFNSAMKRRMQKLKR